MSFIGNGYAEVTLIWRANTTTRDCTCVLGIKNTPGTAPAALATDFDTFLKASGHLLNAAKMSSLWAYRGIRVVAERGSGPEIFQLNQNIAGSLVQDPLPPNNAILVSKTSAAGGRRNRGRMYLPPCYVGDAQVDSVGVIGGTQLTALQTLLTLTLADITAYGTPMVLLHSVSEVLPTIVTNLTVQATVATQRRRLRR